MHFDLDRAAPPSLDSSVCIIGAGIAGLTLATRLAARGIDVTLLEAGGLEQEERSQAFYATEQAATTHRGASDGRYRTFGGSSTQWGGQLLPFTADIFDPPPGSPSRSWPVRESQLLPFYDDIQTIFGTDKLPFDASLLPALTFPALPLSSDIVLRFSQWAPFKKRNVAQTLGPVAQASDKINLVTHANVASVEGSAGAIKAVRVLSYAGQEFRFTARHFVVAAGTIESCRILLSSPAVPNEHDQLGRFFNDHLALRAAYFDSPAREQAIRSLGPFFKNGTLYTGKMEAAPAARGRDRMYAAMAHVVVLEPEDSGAAALRSLLRSLQHGKLKEALGRNLLPMLRGAGDVARLLLQAKFGRRRAVSKRADLVVNIEVEQAPDANNRIRLSEAKDALGLPVAIVDWRVNETEHETARAFAKVIRREFAALGMTSLRWHPSVDDGSVPPLFDTYHAMGGLCMGTDPATSVVDPLLQVHGLSNLHVASCAVFPSGSSSNPTFTMMALTMRLGDRLAELLGR